jgi:3-dehydroquinate synthase
LSQVQVYSKAESIDYQIRVGRRLLEKVGSIARSSLPRKTKRIALISNQRVFSLYGPRVVNSLKTTEFAVDYWLMDDGEKHKSLRSAEAAIRFFSDKGLTRTDAVVALGGGVVGDLAGFAASIYMRGLPLLQIPTTLLAQIDSSVGGKTAVNFANAKNLIGSFHPPRAVVVDVQTLSTLPRRELTAGWCEAVKQGAVASKRLFQQTVRFIGSLNSNASDLSSSQLEELITSHCEFKASIVAADPHEDVERAHYRSRRVLNFGHTIGHALEAVTRYRRFRHGEAVGHGMLVAGAISKNLGLLKASELESLSQAVGLCGPLPAAQDLDSDKIVEMLVTDKKRIAGQNQWVLLERIGRARIVNGDEVSSRVIKQSVREALQPRRIGS